MEVTLPLVIALWGLANGVLAAILVGYGADAFPLVLHLAVTVLLELVAAAAWWSSIRRPEHAASSPAPVSGQRAFIAASAVPFLWLGFVYHPWMMFGAAYPVLNLLLAAFRRLLPPRPKPELVAVPHEEPEQSAAPVAAAVGVGAVTAAAGLTRFFRRRRSR